MKLTVLILMLQVCFIQAFSQTNYQPGLIHKTNGEVINGWIDYREWNRNPEEIRFKATMTEVAASYTNYDISLFEITGKETFIKAIVSKDMRPVALENLTTDHSDSLVMDTVFLRVLVNAPRLSLYALNEDKEHFYIKGSTGNFEELTYKVYLNNDGGLSYTEERPVFRQQLLGCIENDPNFSQLQKKLKNMRYEEKELTSFIRKVNNVVVSPDQIDKKKKSAFFVAAGMQVSTLKVAGFPHIGDMDYSTTVTPAFALGIDVLSGRSLNDFTIRLSLGYSVVNSTGTQTSADWTGKEMEQTYSLKVNSVTPAVSLLYSFLRNTSYRVYGGFGLGYNLSSFPTNDYTETIKSTNVTTTKSDYLSLEKNWMSISAHLGAIIKERFEVTAATNIAGTFSKYVNYTLKPSVFSFNVAYRF